MWRTLAGLEARLGRPLPPHYEATLRAAMAQAFRERLQVIPGAFETLRGLAKPYCIASNGPRAKMDLTLEITGLAPHFGERVFSAYEVGSFKPEPGLFLHAAAAMGVVPARCVVVEDSLAGVEAGVAAGMLVYVLAPAPPLPAAYDGRVQVLEHLPDLCRAPWNR
jgi:HAD superfamily hydrolase (TIGR01509 family)